MAEIVPVRIAARQLGVTPAIVRVWLRRGAPCVRRDRPALVNVEDLRVWRKGNTVETIARALLDVLRREYAEGKPAHQLIGLQAAASAKLLLAAYDRIHIALEGHEPEPPYSEAIRQLRRIAGARDE